MALSLIFDGEIINLPYRSNSMNQKSENMTMSKDNIVKNFEKSNNKNERFIDDNGNFIMNRDIQVIVDKVTGVHYLSDSTGGLTPLLDKQGSIVIKKKRKK
ncbi:MAG: DUF6440 family protein [Enterococcus faecalis]|uniref:DUF6440 family protein n=1 Tax=Enterococcus faecalis TaxID=1351 RepID=UPI000666868E|nr:DUF6440 family protein [Enterococcus faecalis]MDU6310816.1 DUF6440 family protein [Enterococcus faecalis]